MGSVKCRLCRKEDGVYRIKEGKICRHCLDRMPESVQKKCDIFTERELARLSRRMIEPDIWGQFGALGIGKEMISINGRGIRLNNLKMISLNFHPLKEGRRSGTVVGKVTVLAELRCPHIVIEEPLLMEAITVFYHISKKDITYKYSEDWAYLIEMIQECLEKRRHDMTPYREKACSIMRKYNRKKAEEEKRAANERREKEVKKRAEEARRKAEERQKKTYKEQEKKARGKWGSQAFQKAKKLYQVEMPYTTKELKEKRRSLLKICHPDAGGNAEMAKEVNVSYDLLYEYAVS